MFKNLDKKENWGLKNQIMASYFVFLLCVPLCDRAITQKTQSMTQIKSSAEKSIDTIYLFSKSS